MNHFEGYYVKCISKNSALAIIFGRQKCGVEKSSFIQIITDKNSYNIAFEYEDFVFVKKPFKVCVGNNKIDHNGICLDFSVNGLDFKGKVSFGKFTPIKYDIMGFFKFFPFMECLHTITSINHTVSGQIFVGDQCFDFENGCGYIEGDKGYSFPKKYFWTQCNLFESLKNPSISASCAIIPYLGIKFTGTICVIHFAGHEYRLATYLGARVKVFNENKLTIVQGIGKRRKLLEIEVVVPKCLQSLLAPTCGDMKRTVHESVCASVRYKFSIGAKQNPQTLFETKSDYAAYEFSESKKKI